MVVMTPVDEAEVPDMDEHAPHPGQGQARWRQTLQKMEDLDLTHRVQESYRTQTARKVGRDFPELFGGMSDSQIVNTLSDIRSHLGWPSKNPGAARRKKRGTTRKERVTPQTVDAAFSKMPTADSDKAMKALAAALLPYIIPAVLDDLSTSIGLVKRART